MKNQHLETMLHTVLTEDGACRFAALADLQPLVAVSCKFSMVLTRIGS